MATKQHKVLIIEDEPDVIELLSSYLNRLSTDDTQFEIERVDDGNEASLY